MASSVLPHGPASIPAHVVLRSELSEAAAVLDAAALLLEIGASPETLRGMADRLRASAADAQATLRRLFE